MTKKRMLFIVLGLLLLINAGCSGSNESRNETKARAKTETASVKTAQGNDRLPNIRILATGGQLPERISPKRRRPIIKRVQSGLIRSSKPFRK